MADYHSLIARAIEGLENNTGEARRALYERARVALVAQLRGVTPPLGESDITRERLGLEEAIRKIEAEQARRGRLERSLSTSRPTVPAEPAPPPAAVPVTESVPTPSQELPENPAPLAEQQPPAPSPKPAAPVEAESAPEPSPPPDDAPVEPHPLPQPPRVRRGRRAAAPSETDPTRLDEALRALRNRTASGRDEVVPQWPRTTPREPPRAEREADDRDRDRPHESPADEVQREADYDTGHADADLSSDYSDDRPPHRLRRPLSGAVVKVVVAVVVLAVLGTLAAVGYRERASLIALYQLFSGPPPVTREQARQQPKIEDRVGGPAQPERLPGAEQRAGAPATQPLPAVAQRVVLYEEDPNDPAGKRYVGSVIWRTETVSPGPGLAPELAVKANIEIPERRITMAFSMVRNTDTALPASHTIDIRFNLPPGFPGGGVANVPGILMKQAEQTRGVPLAGIAVKVTNNVFLIGLSSVDTDVQRNVQLLKERTWFDIPIVYSNGSRAILAMEKGTPGERAFNDAFTAWGTASTGATRGAQQ